MSFILDALKKSESDRQRQGGPALFEVKVAPPRGGLPLWAVAIAVLFVANLAVVGWLLLRHAAAAPASAQPALAAAPTPAAPSPPPAAAPPALARSEPPPPEPAAALPHARALPEPPPPEAQAPAAAGSGEGSDPDDFAPAAEAPPSAGIGRVKRGTDAGVPLYQQLAATPNTQLPQLRLDLHAYADRPEDRWVLINMHKLREGDSLEGVHVERITPDGAVLSFQGSQFLLTQE